MTVVTIDQMLDKQNRTRYWLAKQTDIYYPSLAKLCNNETTSIHFDTLEKICDALCCVPSDIMFLHIYYCFDKKRQTHNTYVEINRLHNTGPGKLIIARAISFLSDCAVGSFSDSSLIPCDI